MSWKKELDELAKREKLAEKMGGTAKLLYGEDTVEEFKVEDYRSVPGK